MSVATMSSSPPIHQSQLQEEVGIANHSFNPKNRRGTMPNLPHLNLIANSDPSSSSSGSPSSSSSIQRRNSLNNLNLLIGSNNLLIKHQKQRQINNKQNDHPPTHHHTPNPNPNPTQQAAALLLQLLSSHSESSNNRRHSSSALLQTKQIRAAQLNLLAQQANLASTGSSNLKTAKVANMVLGTAVVVAAEKRRQSMGQFKKSNLHFLLQPSTSKGVGKDEAEGNPSSNNQSAISSDSEEEAESSQGKNSNPKTSTDRSASFSSFGTYHDLLNSNKLQRSEEVTQEYAEQLAKTFQGDSFLDVAGEVARDYATFYKAEREWTGRALRRQSQEEEAQEQVENKMDLDVNVNNRSTDGGVGVGKGKKRELEEERNSDDRSINSNESSKDQNNHKRQRSMHGSASSPEFIRVDPTVIASLESSRKSSISASKIQSNTSPKVNPMNPPNSIPSPSSTNHSLPKVEDASNQIQPRRSSRISPLSSRRSSPVPLSNSNSNFNSSSSSSSSSNPIISITPSSTNPSLVPTTTVDDRFSANQPKASSSALRSQSLTNPSFSNWNLNLGNLAHRSQSLGSSLSSSLVPQGFTNFNSNHSGSGSNSPTPPRLTSVLSNFATLLQSREESCEGLESLVKNSKSLSPLPNVYEVLEEQKRAKQRSSIHLNSNNSNGFNENGGTIFHREGEAEEDLKDESMESS